MRATQRPRAVTQRPKAASDARGDGGDAGQDGQAARDSPLAWANIARAARGLPPTTDEAATPTDWALGRLLKEEAMLRHDMGEAAKRLREIAKQRAAFIEREQQA